MPSSQWVFGPFRLDPANACLWCDTEALILPPKAFAVLHYLVTHLDRLVSKDELLDAVWPETAVSDAVVRIAIGELRRALGDTAQASRYIATVQRRGYRFVAPVVEHAEAIPGTTSAPPLETPDTPHHQEVGPLTPALLLPEAERRHLTVLFCDLVDSTALAGRLDPEDYREVVRAYHQICAEVLQRFDGYLAQYLGDGVLGYFGYPVAHEDDAQRAVRAGLDLLDALAPLLTHPALPPGDQVAVRLGIHTGLVVMGDVGTGARHEPLALGETPNIAARLQHLAAPNTLVLSAATHQLIAGYFRCEALGEQTLQGLAQPLGVYRVLGASGAQSRLEVAATHGLTPLVGRAQEVELLMACWTRVTEGMGQVVILGGEAGIGKSRLVQVLKERVAGEGHPWLECQGSPYYQHTALYPLTELLARGLLHVEHEATAAQKVHQLEAFLIQHDLSPAEAVPLFAPLLSLPLPATYASVQVSPEQQRQQTLHMLLELLLRLAAEQPLLLIMEDLHWVDPSTLEWLSLLVDQGPIARILALCTCRPDFRPPWTGRSHCTQVMLARLPQRQATELTHQVAQGKALPAQVLFGLWRFYLVRSQLHTARELGETLLRLAQHAHDPALAVAAHYALGVTWWWLGAFPAARQHLEECIARYTPDQRRAPVFRMGQDLGVSCRTYAAWTLWLLGYPEQALARLHDALTLAHELSHLYSLAFARCWAAFVSQFRRDVLAVYEHAEDAVALSTEWGFTNWSAHETSLRGWALAMRGQGEVGMAQVRQGIAAWRATGALLHVPYFCTLLAEVSAHLSHPEDGLQVLAEAYTLVEQHEERYWEAEIHRLRGVLLLRQPGTPQAEAEACFQRALDIAHRQEAKSLELRAAMSLGRLWQQQGKRTEAYDLVASIYGWFTEGFDTADLQDARALLQELA